ncbi:hypothetical protein MUO14_02875 [Halobacillus shinanisalinarum]|uniref:Uncharacterized protein n=1 Tax=Halobacillus shinanisalinarum TaxID=2932258 RepID=A0ABY4H4N3_9BACI|nr:hypothetical protein [Halobacillus shinanisalinarum]UOQ93937.1 hypothetical protein MUO14_02875 [Halobacillus shinanisalinarum]
MPSIALAIVAVVVAYPSVNWEADKEATETENVTLSNGGQIALSGSCAFRQSR